MRAVKSEEYLKAREEEDECHLHRSISADDLSGDLRQNHMATTTQAIISANHAKYRQLSPIDKTAKRKELYRSKMKIDAHTDPINIGSLQCESAGKEIKDGGRPSTGVRQRSIIKDHQKEPTQNVDLCKRCSTPVEVKLEKATYGDEGFFDDEQTKSPVMVEDLSRNNDSDKNSDNSENTKNIDSSINKTCLLSVKPKKRICYAMIVWLGTFVGALLLYFSLFVVIYKYEPFYSVGLEMVGLKADPPPPPASWFDQLYGLIRLIGLKLYGAHLYLMNILYLPFNNKS